MPTKSTTAESDNSSEKTAQTRITIGSDPSQIGLLPDKNKEEAKRKTQQLFNSFGKKCFTYEVWWLQLFCVSLLEDRKTKLEPNAMITFLQKN